MSSNQKRIIKKLKKAYKKNKKYFAFYADYLFKNGYDEKAEEIIKENKDSFPDYTSGLLVLGEIYYSRKEYQNAESIFLKVLELNKKSVKALKNLANIESIRKNKKGQFDYLSDVLRYDAFDQDAKNFILMFSGKFGDEEAPASSYFSEKMSQLLDNDLVDQALKVNDYKSTYDMKDFTEIALKEQQMINKENAENSDLNGNLEDTLQGELDISKKTISGIEIEKDEEIELRFKNTDTKKRNLLIERDYEESDDLELTDKQMENDLDQIESDLDEIKTESESEPSVPEGISEIFESSSISDDESLDEDIYDTSRSNIYSSLNPNIKSMNKFTRKLEKDPDNIEFKGDFHLSRSSFIKQKLMCEIEYYKKMVEKYPENNKYKDRLASYENELQTADVSIIK